MRLRDNRVWAVVIAAAFLLLWFAGVGAAYAAPLQEPLPEPVPAVQSTGARIVGTAGWCIIAIGFLGVGLCVALDGRFRRRRRRAVRSAIEVRHPDMIIRSVSAPASGRRYRRNIERRF